MDHFRIVKLTSTNAEVQLIKQPKVQSILFAIDRLNKCYPEQSDVSWTGHKMKRNRHKCQLSPLNYVENTRTVSPVTKSMTRNVENNEVDWCVSFFLYVIVNHSKTRWFLRRKKCSVQEMMSLLQETGLLASFLCCINIACIFNFKRECKYHSELWTLTASWFAIPSCTCLPPQQQSLDIVTL